MPHSEGSQIYGGDGSVYRLSREVGSGGEGSVWSLEGYPKLVAKLYHKAILPTHVAKLETMCALRTEALAKVAAWPVSLLSRSRKGSPQGILMPRIVEHQSVNQLYGIKSRLRSFPEAQFPFMLHAAMNTARAFANIHDAGQVIGDVNHSNLLVSQNATVSLIDCDSFQITSGNRLFHCNVGVPEFTPPELQGKNFTLTARTTEHDNFGLAILIFYMLFLGRHPFMGMYDSKAGDILSLEQAISGYKFPYALPQNSTEVRLPPFGPHLADFPDGVQTLFRRAFTKHPLSSARPSAQEWISTLSSIASTLKQCNSNPSHQYFPALASCPWCRVEGTIGIPIFGVKVTLIDAIGFNITITWAQIAAIEARAEDFTLPDSKQLKTKYIAEPDVSRVARQRRVYRTWSIVTFLIILFIAANFFNAFFAVTSIAFALFWSRKLWLKGKALTQNYYDKSSESQTTYNLLLADLRSSAGIPEQFRSAKSKLESAKREYDSLPDLKAKEFAQLKKNQEKKQRQHFLEKFRLEDERIPNIGPKNKAILYTWGILDASDISASAISQIKGFGPVKRDALLDWRAEKERGFRFDPSLPIDPRDVHKLDQEFAKRNLDLQNSLTAGPNTLKQVVSVWRAQRSQLANRIWTKADELAKDQANVASLRGF